MTIQGKVWGTTLEFFRNGIVSAHHLSIKKGGYCSKHVHRHKYNLFYVISGLLEISIWKDKTMEDKTILGPGQSSAVPPEFKHCFRALEKTECIEIYQVLLVDPDIERDNQGGLDRK